MMKKLALLAGLLCAALSGNAFEDPLRFKQVSDHCFFLRFAEGETVAAIVTDDGVLLLDPPSGRNLQSSVEALKHLTAKPVRWVLFSSAEGTKSDAARFFSDQGAALLAAAGQRSSQALPGAAADTSAPQWLIFNREIKLFPSNLEVRVTAVQKARTSADVVLYVPGERILFAGNFYDPAAYPEIDESSGSPAGWIEALKRVVDSIPVLKPAISRTKPDPKIPEKTLEEGIQVISSRGEVSTLQNMKDLLGVAQKLRADISRAVKGRRSCGSYLKSPRADTFRVYGNFEQYAGGLCEELSNMERQY